MTTPNIHDELEDRIPANDHDLLIRVHERVTSIQSQIISYSENYKTLSKRVEDIERWKDNLMGKFSVIVVVASLIGGILSQIVISWTKVNL
jgi:hypothetical protein